MDWDEGEIMIIGSSRLAEKNKLFLGSTAQRVILEAGCPVTAVKADVGPST